MDFKLPQDAFVNKFVAKSKFYERVSLSTKLQNEFINKIKKITWKYKLAEETIGVSKTDTVTEIQIFDIELKEQIIPKNVLKIIDKAIPYQILYRFIYNNSVAYGITLKESNKAEKYYFKAWDEKVEFDFTGIDLEKIYQKLVKTFIRKKALDKQGFKLQIDLDHKIEELEKNIYTIEKQIKKEKQFNRKVEINKILLKKKKELNQIIK
jgi:hypothetical protein